MPPRFSLAKRKAAELLRLGGIQSAPVLIERLVELAGAEIHYEPFEGQVSGLMQHRSGRAAIIGVNSAHPPTRQRFTIAHELGHLMLHRREPFHIDEKPAIRFRDRRSSLAEEPEEIEANQFAAELLMPEFLMDEELSLLPDDIDPEEAILLLADRFEVSEQAMTLRLNRLGVFA